MSLWDMLTQDRGLFPDVLVLELRCADRKLSAVHAVKQT